MTDRVAIIFFMAAAITCLATFLLGLFLGMQERESPELTPPAYAYEYRCYVNSNYEVCVLMGSEHHDSAQHMPGFRYSLWRGEHNGNLVAIRGGLTDEEAISVLLSLR